MNQIDPRNRIDENVKLFNSSDSTILTVTKTFSWMEEKVKCPGPQVY